MSATEMTGAAVAPSGAAGASGAEGQPAVYVWEATNEDVARISGLPLSEIVRFDLNTSPAPPPLAARVLASGTFETVLSEYPPSDYRRLVDAASMRYGVPREEILVGAGADEVLDIVAKAFLPAGGIAVVPVPSYAMYPVLSDHRAARLVAVPRLGAAEGYAMDVPAVRAAARAADLVWLCDPNNPTGLPEPDGAVATLLTGLEQDALEAGGTPPAVCIDEAYAEFVGRSNLPLRHSYPRLVIVRTLSKAYALAGMRVGFAIAAPRTLAILNPYRPPGSVATPSVTVGTEALLDPAAAEDNVARVQVERGRFAKALADIGWPVRPSVTNFLLVPLGSRERAVAAAAFLVGRGVVPRTFGADHPLADHLRITVRTAEQDDRFVAAVRDFERSRQNAHR